MRISMACTLAFAVVLGGCGQGPAGPDDAGYFRASVSGAVDERYEGSGEFHTGTPGPGRQQFQISSYRGSRSGQPSFAITHWDGGRLGVGTYPLALVGLDGYERDGWRSPRGLTVQYFRTAGTHEEQFVAEAGELEITHSSGRRVEGRFVLTGMRYCRRETVRSNPPEPPQGPCTLVSSPIEGAPRITVTGSFSAVPLDVGSVELR